MPYPSPAHSNLFDSILSLRDKKEVAAFFRDLLTIGELDAASERWQIAKLLWTTTLSYQEIAKKIGVSTTTITRVAHWLKNGKGGYQIVLSRLFGPHRK